MTATQNRVVDREGIASLLGLLQSDGYRTIGPTVRGDIVVLDELEDVSDLPTGRVDEQGPAHYRLSSAGSNELFAFTVGPDSLKRHLFPPSERILTITSVDGTIAFEPERPAADRMAFIGARACDLAALSVHDRVLIDAEHGDPRYTAARHRSLIVAVTCSTASTTCFCSSMGTGPACGSGYDILITELATEDDGSYLLEPGTDEGAELVARMPGRKASGDDAAAKEHIISATAAAMGRAMTSEPGRRSIEQAFESPAWDDVAARCFACGNCTLVCPTCFCTTVVDATGFDGTAIRTREWDTCFSLEFTNLHGRPARSSVASRYRQWITHKLAYWHHQFDMSGCVGCGRCITWCPAGIDIRVEAERLAPTVNGATA